MIIFSQNSPNYRHMKYGKGTVGKCGCEAVAACNALEFLGRGIPFADVVKAFEMRFSNGGGFLAKGRLGATPLDVSLFLRSRGLNPESGTLRQLSEIKSPGVFIVSYWNKPFTKGIHTIAVDYDGKRYTAANYEAKLCSKERLEDFLPDRIHFLRGYYISK